MTVYIGIDPGSVSGAYAAIDHNNTFIGCGDIPSANGRIQPRLLRTALEALIPKGDSAEIIIETVASRPGQGVCGVFNFGRAVGVIEAVTSMMLYPVHYVTPQAWKRHHEIIGKPKSASLDIARAKWPTAPLKLKKHHGRADALCLCLWGLENLQ